MCATVFTTKSIKCNIFFILSMLCAHYVTYSSLFFSLKIKTVLDSYIICDVISNPLFPRDQVCTFTSAEGPISVSPNIRGKILLQKVHKCSHHFQRSHQWLAGLTTESSWGSNVKILHTHRNHIHGEQICQQKMVLILHASATFFHSPAHEPSFWAQFLNSQLHDFMMQITVITLMTIMTMELCTLNTI